MALDGDRDVRFRVNELQTEIKSLEDELMRSAASRTGLQQTLDQSTVDLTQLEATYCLGPFSSRAQHVSLNEGWGVDLAPGLPMPPPPLRYNPSDSKFVPIRKATLSAYIGRADDIFKSGVRNSPSPGRVVRQSRLKSLLRMARCKFSRSWAQTLS